MSQGSTKGMALLAVFAALCAGLALGLSLRPPSPRSSVALQETIQQMDLATLAEADIAPVRIPAPGTRAPSPRESVVVHVAKRVSPAVVTVGKRVDSTRQPTRGIPVRRLLQPYTEETLRTFAEGPPEKKAEPYIGSGILFGAGDLLGGGFNPSKFDPIDRYVVTNYHVIQSEGDVELFVTLADGRVFDVTLLDADAVVDIAVLRVTNPQQEEIPGVTFGDSTDIMIGESVVALGNPFGPVLKDPHPTLTLGVISALGRSFEPKLDASSGRPRAYRGMIQTDASINPGNSGGPLVNFDGEIVGINTFIISDGQGGPNGVNFAIPINRAVLVAREILEYGEVRPIYVDLDVWTVNRYLMRRYGLEIGTGLFVWKMAKSGPAYTAGLRDGDVIVKVEGRPAYRPEDLIGEIYTRTVGEHINLTVAREDRSFETEYIIQQAPVE